MSVLRARRGGHPYQRGDDPIYDWLDREYTYGPFRGQGAPAAKTTSATLTAADLFKGVITVVQGGGATSNLQMPTGTDIEAAFKSAMGHDLENDDAFDFYLINNSSTAAETASITVNTDVTIVGRAMVDAIGAGNASSGRFRVRRTGAHVYVVYRIG